MAAALQQTPITFRSRSPSSSQIQSQSTIKLSLSSSLKLPRFTIKSLRCARMADTAAGSYANETLPPTAEELENAVFSEDSVLSYFTNLIKEIAKEFERIYNELTDTQVATVTSVVQLEARHLAEIAKRVQKLTGAKNVSLKTAIDESLVAGFTIRYGNSGSKLIDLSVKKQLEEIAAQLHLRDIQLAV